MMGMGKVSIVLALIVASLVVFAKVRSRREFHVPSPTLARPAGMSEDPCDKKQKCVVYYMAPWCPACEQTLPTVLEISRRWNGEGSTSPYGLRILIGNSTHERSQALASRIGWIASVDPRDEFSNKHNVASFPTWIVFDNKGHELSRLSGGIADPSMADAFIKQGLKL